MSVSPIPEGFNRVSPYLLVKDAHGFVRFLKDTFDAEVLRIIPNPGGGIGHAEVRICDSVVMLADTLERFAESEPEGGPMLHVYVEDVDATYARALAAGATSGQAPADQYYGDRSATVADGFGITWLLATHREDVSGEELKRRAAAAHSLEILE